MLPAEASHSTSANTRFNFSSYILSWDVEEHLPVELCYIFAFTLSSLVLDECYLRDQRDSMKKYSGLTMIVDVEVFVQ